MSVDMSVELKPLEELVKELTPQARLELRDFAEFLWHKQMTPVAQDLGWPPDFFEEVAGGWQGEKLVREDQGQYEIREELE